MADRIQNFTELKVVPGAMGGWAIEGFMAGEWSMLCGIADDEGLLEFFAGQLGFDAPKPAAADEAFTNSAANLSADLEKVQTELDQREMQVRLIVEALQPFVAMAKVACEEVDSDLLTARIRNTDHEYASINAGHLRALIRAAGLWSDEMAPSPPPPAAVEEVRATAPPPPAVDLHALAQTHAHDDLAGVDVARIDPEDNRNLGGDTPDFDDERPF